MALIRVNLNPSVRELRQFAGILLPLFFLVVGGSILYSGGSTITAAGLAGAGIVIGGIGFARPSFMRPIYLGWIYAAYPIGWVVSHITMGIVFYLVVTPLGAAMRLTGYDPMRVRVPRTQTTYWTKCEPVGSKRDYFRQY